MISAKVRSPYVPMAARHDGDKYLVERWRNVVFTPASQTRLKDDVSRNWKALGLGVTKALPNVFSGGALLTLSACNTATGGNGATGKEVEGFGVLAQRQGAKAVIASLWPVADRSTKNLMQEFYKLREAKANTTKAEAMQQAQIQLLRGELQVTGEALAARSIIHEEDKTANQPKFKVDPKAPDAHPYYWAPFILIGNWK